MKQLLLALLRNPRRALSVATLPRLLAWLHILAACAVYAAFGMLRSPAFVEDSAKVGVHIVVTPRGEQYIRANQIWLGFPLFAGLLAVLFLPISSDVTRAFEDSEKLRDITNDNDHNVI